MFVVAKDLVFLHYLNLVRFFSSTIITAIIPYTFNIIVPHKLSQIQYLGYQIGINMCRSISEECATI